MDPKSVSEHVSDALILIGGEKLNGECDQVHAPYIQHTVTRRRGRKRRNKP